MFSTLLCNFLTLVITTTSFSPLIVFSLDIPSIACPELFQYLSHDDNYIGKITLNRLPFSTIKVEAQFSQRESIVTNYNGDLSLIESLETTEANLKSGNPVSYRVNFPVAHVLPKLTSIKVNGRTMCAANGIPAPSTTFTLQHTFYPSSTVMSAPALPTTSFQQPQIIFNENSFPKFSIRPVQTTLPDRTFNEEFVSKFFKDFDETVDWKNFKIGNGFDFNTNKPTVIVTAKPAPQPIAPTIPPTKATTRAPTTPRPTPRKKAPTRPPITCGQETTNLTPFVVGGNIYKRGRFPWLTAIYVRQSADLKFTCGGSLISRRTVISAAHCFEAEQVLADRIVVQLGRHNLFSSEIGVEQRDLQTLIIHPEYNRTIVSDADIALLLMSVPVSFTEFISPICLWSSSVGFWNNVGFTAGWGADNKGYDVTPVPKFVEVEIASEADCLRSSDIFRVLTSSRSLCAGSRQGNTPCIGDSGGGLMINDNGKWVLRAVTSLGITYLSNNRKTCSEKDYVVYCDISKHVTWVKQNTMD